MGIYGVHLFGGNSRIVQTVLYNARYTLTIWMGGCKVISVTRKSSSYYLSIDAGASGQSVVQIFEYKSPCSLTENETVSSGIEGP